MSYETRYRTLVKGVADKARKWRADHFDQDENEAQMPLRSELFTVSQMEQHGMALANSHVLSHSPARERLLDRLEENRKVLIDASGFLTQAVRDKRQIAPAGEWLLDNFYLIEEQIRTAKRHLPRNYSRELPRLAQGKSRGLPRVYDLALEEIAHGDGEVDAETLSRYVAAYQAVTPLTLGELWAIPIMLRLALIENLRRVAVRITTARSHLNLAQDWANQMMEVAESDPKSLILVIADMARSNPPLASPFVAELVRRLQGHGPSLALPLTWIEQRLAESNQTIEQMVRLESQQQAADKVSISNTIGSLRSLSEIDWRVFVESMSFVEQILREDAGNVYHDMTFATRDRYRHVVARVAKQSGMSEIDVARKAISLTSRDDEGDLQTTHVGFYLIDQGLSQLEGAVSIRLPAMDHLRRWAARFPLPLYLGAIFALTAAFATGLFAQVYDGGAPDWRQVLLGLLSLLAASQLASSLTNWLATLLTNPQLLPRMDYTQGLPADMCTLVVIPTLLGSAENVDELIESLEVRFLGNRDEHIHFGLLTDFHDARQEVLASDEMLLHRAAIGIKKLNETYRGTGHDRFFLFHRPRRWDASQRIWMGYERKRGKLADLNATLRGDGQDRFSLVVGNLAALPHVKYVITLDTDTQLPRDMARQFVGAMAHPLNRPRYDEKRQRVIGGYGILQPSMAATMSGAYRSRYARLCGMEPGIDPYTRSVSNVYQDLFGEGSFIGKGIYDVDAFERVLRGRFPENRILSHDLLEGCFARSGLLSDLHLYEEYPARYEEDVCRQERWIRGDWQIAHWLLPRVPALNGRDLPNPLSSLSRWKILDNLRRSMVPAAMVMLLLLGWYFVPQVWLWTLAVVGTILIPTVLLALVDLLRKSPDMLLSEHLSTAMQSVRHNFSLAAFRIVILPHEALFSVHAILRAIWRMLVTKRHMLDWRVASMSERRHRTGILSSYRSMWISPVVASAALVVSWPRADAFLAASVFACIWLVAPFVTWWLSQPLVRRQAKLSEDQLDFLRATARKTWLFFERFVGAEDNWLPPDNFQEVPNPVIAHRTSPTNIGLALLANLAARDFGYISVGALLDRTKNTLGTMTLLERYQGHFYNWYDTLSLQPLPPRYISSVDSGNLAAHLLTLSVGLRGLPDQKIVDVRQFSGLHDTLNILADTTVEAGQIPIARMRALLTTVESLPSPTLPDIFKFTEAMANDAGAIAVGSDVSTAVAAEAWSNALVRQSSDMLEELVFLAPWLTLAAMPAGVHGFSESGHIPTLRELAEYARKYLPIIDAQVAAETTLERRDSLRELRRMIALGTERAVQRMAMAERLAQLATGFSTMSYGFLYDEARHLLAIGYNVDEFRRDPGVYDLLASEARLCNFVGIAQGKLPQKSWFALGRLLTSAGGERILVSWGGSMFEYLMPLLVMPSYDGTLLDQTCHAAVARQIAFGGQHSLPWGMSESGYNAVDANLNYRYHAFGVPGLGLKRGLADDSVVTPYASALALMVAPEAACANLQRLASCGLEGLYGFYEAIDYTPSRLARGEASAIVRSFMAHHQGMSLLSLGHLLLDRPMQRRFESDPMIQAALLLLQERIPKTSITHMQVAEGFEASVFSDGSAISMHAPIGAETATPEVHLLSNGRYHVMVSNAGGGYSRWRDLAVTRWREDSTCDNWGAFLYLRDADSGEFWSATYQPTLKIAKIYEAMFTEGRAEYRRFDHDIETYSEIVVSPEDDIELRRVKITNRSRVSRTIELTSYAEVVLATQEADAMHPAFGNLFVQTEIIENSRAILCTRRPRSIDEKPPWMFHMLATNGAHVDEISYETDRMRFIGRGRTVVSPQAMLDVGRLSGSNGSVLDPVVSIRCLVTLEPGQSAKIDWVSGAGDSREDSMALVEKYQDRHLANRVFDLSCTHGGVMLRQLNVSEADAQLYRRLAGYVLYANAELRAESGIIAQNRRGQSGLWGYAISGDLPIVLLRISDAAHIDLAQQMIQCHAYWRMKGLIVDLVIWNEDHAGYRQQLQDQIMGLITSGAETNVIDRPGGIFVRSSEHMSHEDRILIQSVARAIITDGNGTLIEQLNCRDLSERKMPRLATTRLHRPQVAAEPEMPRSDLVMHNDLGGFTEDGSEYVITTAQAAMTPAPWVNVIANARFGTVVSEGGLAYTWSENAHEFRLTPWSGDAVGASGGEAFYLRDEESGYFWSPTPQPCSGMMPYRSRHGFGYSVFEHTAVGIHSELWIYVDLEESVKYSVLRIRNGSGRTRRLSATGYVEWVLGDQRHKCAPHVITEVDSSSGALFARNAYNSEFEGRVAFFDVDDLSRTLTGDRNEFLGRNGSPANPDALVRARLSGRVGAAMDPCGAIQVPFELADGQEREIIFRLGSANDIASARALASRLQATDTARAALENVRRYWQRTLGTVQIETPDPALNLLTNGWLVYQTLACRLWARSGFYQSGGAFGFRDQLQDVMALVHTEPKLVREHLLRCAGRQYPEGDVQHWWHPPAGRGVRTRCSDDYLWLPLAVCRYVSVTGDIGVLEEQVSFLASRALSSEEESYYDLPGRSSETGTLYEHCVRAIKHGLKFGEHGLPLMGSGDWNDGMNLVGIHGHGESVWLGFFLYDVLMSFIQIASEHGDVNFADQCGKEAERLGVNLETHAWDGAWYRRAWFDDGELLGSSVNSECTIDSTAQSWSVLSGAGDVERTQQAMAALDQRLVRLGPADSAGLIKLLDPPFDTSAMNPGYIKGYVPGVRENGGQYTHAAVWAIMAFAALGNHRRAWELVALINPLNHARNAAEVGTYKIEPYVVAADIYAIAPHAGRGGWSWYTGSAGWLYRLITESLLGLRRAADKLSIEPSMPEDWQTYTLRYRYGDTNYRIVVVQLPVMEAATEQGISGIQVSLDGVVQQNNVISLSDDHQDHRVDVRLQRTAAPRPAPVSASAADQKPSLAPAPVPRA